MGQARSSRNVSRKENYIISHGKGRGMWICLHLSKIEKARDATNEEYVL
jgi:predicted RNA-binding protein YlxR (DUF448 family)